MPLGNLTSQFFANIYLNELDQFVKHTLKVKYYIRYVDDFAIFHHELSELNRHKQVIQQFLTNQLHLTLHPGKSKIDNLKRGIPFLGLKIFPHHKSLTTKNRRSFYRTYELLYSAYLKKEIDYDTIYNFLEGWLAYAHHANTHKLCQKIRNTIEIRFPGELSSKEINRHYKLCAAQKQQT